MLENATVTMPYNEFQGIIGTMKEQEQELKELRGIEEAFDTDPLKKCLDSIFNLLDAASSRLDSAEKQALIYQCMCQYCDTFSIPRDELLSDVPDGTETSYTAKKEIAKVKAAPTRRLKKQTKY